MPSLGFLFVCVLFCGILLGVLAVGLLYSFVFSELSGSDNLVYDNVGKFSGEGKT